MLNKLTISSPYLSGVREFAFVMWAKNETE